MKVLNHPPGLVAILTRPTGLTASWPCIIQLKEPAGTGHGAVTGTSIPLGRNLLVRSMLKVPAYKWLLFIDDDQTFPPDALMRLLDADKPIIGAVIPGKYAPFEPWVFFGTKETGLRRAKNDEVHSNRGVTKIAAIGTGFLLIRREVFEGLEDPWFEAGKMQSEGVGEDVWFCLKAQEAGFPIHVDMALRVGHLTVMSVVLKEDGTPQLTHDRHMVRQTII